jgi:RND family efflux transporter MFP subunit
MRAVTLLFSCAALLSGCRDAKPATASPPAAKVENAVKESELSRVTLTPEAETRIGIKVAGVADKDVPDTRILAGEVVVPPGMSFDVAAPVAGTVAAAAEAEAVSAGRLVRRGEPLFRIVPLLPAERDLRINAERDAAAAAAIVDAARKKVARAEQLLADGSGSRRALEEARAELGNAEAAVKAADERLAVVDRSPINKASELVVSAPSDGIVETVSAASGQAVAASAPLLRISRLDRLWIKVPIYAGDRRALDLQRGAQVLRLDDPPDAPGLPARVVAAPPTANANASAVDAAFELTGRADLHPGERVLVRLWGRGSGRAPVISESALIHDIHGSVWVYEQTGPRVFVRRRVEVRDTAGGLAIVVRGLNPGAVVVTTGAAELYGVEFGAGK